MTADTIHWHRWGQEALAKAKKENKPVFLCVGYFTCFWCHVMEHHIYSDPVFAAEMNRNYICIKVDRDERPDIDEVFMLARQLITNHSGWPNHVFLTPDAEPFMAVGVLTKKPGEGRSLLDVANDIAQKWKESEPAIRQAAGQVAQVLRQELSSSGMMGMSTPDKTVTEDFMAYLCKCYDEEHGGFYTQPKFPHENYLLFLLADYRYRKDDTALEMAALSLKKMAAGGIYDHVGGGFHRYTEDRAWSLPHFEKILTDQALHARCFVELYEITGKSYHRDIAQETLDFALAELHAPEGGFYAALDAETNGVEGAYYVWKEEDLQQILSQKEAELFAKCYQLNELQEIPGHPKADGSVLRARQHLVALANEKNRSYESLHQELQPIIAKLREVRSKRQKPDLDRKIITGWNGLMIETLAEASKILGRSDYLEAALKAAEFVLRALRTQDGGLARQWQESGIKDHGYLEDYAYMESAMITLYEVTMDKKWLQQAIELHQLTDRLFWDEVNGGYYVTDGTENLLVRIHRAHDNGLPSASGEMMHNLLRLYDVTEDELWLSKARVMMAAYHGQMKAIPQDYSTMLQAILYLYR